ncbi:MAG TPA: tetratricopeptide repeat protein [Candidatus Acidoferrales bacterium]|nr:tetratricopeptide repeat protein [Candidatus Acidoferrales bacterium]
MNGKWNRAYVAIVFAGALLGAGSVASAQGSNQSSTAAQPVKPSAQPTPDNKLTLDDAPPPASAEEEAAYKAFTDVTPTDFQKKISVGEDFAQKYPKSRYLPLVYSTLTNDYVQTGQVPKMEEIGEKEIALRPDDVLVLALLGQTIPRALNSSTPNPDQELDKAEKYSKRAIELTPTLPKPPNLTDENFATAKNQTLAMAHSGLGLVYVRRGKFAEAIPELEASVKIDPNPDPVNYYLLGLSNEKTSHFEDSQAAFNKCAALPGSLQATCKKGSEEAKKLSETQMSAPK